jgi:SAM-dependent methyltransferase
MRGPEAAHDVNAREQFGRQASYYVSSRPHAQGADAAVALLEAAPGETALDVGTGAGHTAHALARLCRAVVATDITPEMLGHTRRLAADLGLPNLATAFALAESLPFADASFDLATCRQAAHHFRDVASFCREAARVLRTGGRLLVVDTVVPEDTAVAAFINDVELHRDPSHIEDLPVSRWRRLLEDAGLEVTRLDYHEAATPIELVEWTERSATPPAEVEYIRRRLEGAPADARRVLRLRGRYGTFSWGWPVMAAIARR